MGLVTIPEREPSTKIVLKVRDSLNSFDQLSIDGLLVVFFELWQILGSLQRLTDKRQN